MKYIIIFLISFSLQAQYTLVDEKRKVIKLNVDRFEAEVIASDLKKKKPSKRFYLQSWVKGRLKECEIVPIVKIDYNKPKIL